MLSALRIWPASDLLMTATAVARWTIPDRALLSATSTAEKIHPEGGGSLQMTLPGPPTGKERGQLARCSMSSRLHGDSRIRYPCHPHPQQQRNARPLQIATSRTTKQKNGWKRRAANFMVKIARTRITRSARRRMSTRQGLNWIRPRRLR